MTMKFRNLLTLAFITALTSGCVGQDTKVSGLIDRSEKTISVPAGRRGIEGVLIKSLEKNDWEVDQYDKKETRYQLHINTVRTQLFCLHEWSEVAYEILFIDNKTSEEIIYIAGEDCSPYSNTSKAFEAALLEAENI